MGSIWKYQLTITDQQGVQMPVGSRPLSVGAQHGALVLWVYVPDVAAPLDEKFFFVLGTGNPIPWDLSESTFIGTVQLGGLVWHVWDQAPPEGRT